MKNVKMNVDPKQDKVTIEFKLSERLGLSRSGKTMLVATTEGNVEIDGQPGMFLGLNVYTK